MENSYLHLVDLFSVEVPFFYFTRVWSNLKSHFKYMRWCHWAIRLWLIRGSTKALFLPRPKYKYINIAPRSGFSGTECFVKWRRIPRTICVGSLKVTQLKKRIIKTFNSSNSCRTKLTRNQARLLLSLHQWLLRSHPQLHNPTLSRQSSTLIAVQTNKIPGKIICAASWTARDCSASSTAKISPPPEKGKTNSQDYDNWRQIDRLLKDWILGALSDEVVQTLVTFDTATARDVWLQLEKKFTQSKGSAPPPRPAAEQGTWLLVISNCICIGMCNLLQLYHID